MSEPQMDGRIEKAKQGNREALGFLVRMHYDRVYRFCARRIGDDLAPDAAQETFVTMQKSIRGFEAKSRFETWLLGIANNQCRYLIRKKRLEPQTLQNWLDVAGPQMSDQLLDREALRCALSKLTDDHREVVFLHEIEGLRYAAIAEILGIPEGTVKSRLFHAFRVMRRYFTEQ